MLRTGIAVFVILASALAGAQTKVVKDKFFEYTGPVGYVRDDSRVPSGRIGLFATSKDNYRSNVMISTSTAGTYEDPAKLGQDTVTFLKASDKAVSNVSGKALQVSGNQIYVISSIRKLPNGMSIGQRQAIFIHKKQAVILSFSALNKDANRLVPGFMKSLSSLRWLS